MKMAVLRKGCARLVFIWAAAHAKTLSMKKIKKFGLILGLISTIIILGWVVHCWRESPRGKLPWSARSIQIYSKSYGVQGWTYCLKAELPENDFQKFVSRLGVQSTDSKYEPYVHWKGGGPTNWWNPSSETKNTYFRSNGMGLDILKYENGYVYFKSTGS